MRACPKKNGGERKCTERRELELRVLREYCLFSHNFCSFCGTALNGEEMALKYYFRQGYEYDVIVLFLSKFHGIEMSVRTLKKQVQFTRPSPKGCRIKRRRS